VPSFLITSTKRLAKVNVDGRMIPAAFGHAFGHPSLRQSQIYLGIDEMGRFPHPGRFAA